MNSAENVADLFFENEKKWNAEVRYLRELVLSCSLDESIKWNCPCYTIKNKNIVLIHGFKNYCALSFFKGALLQDEKKILIQQTENVQSARQIRFTNLESIITMQSSIKEYIYEAITVEETGLEVQLKNPSDTVFIAELQAKLDSDTNFKKAFEALTPGRQSGYNFYFGSAKQSATRETRIEKYTPQILNGKGFMDCTCDLSKKMPSCDGSHKFLKENK